MHDLCLAIGGMTVDQLRRRMSGEERGNWIKYIEEYGPVNPMLRFDAAIARAVLPFMKEGTKLRDLMVWPDHSKREITLEEAMRTWR